jgi:hypothetical protein
LIKTARVFRGPRRNAHRPALRHTAMAASEIDESPGAGGLALFRVTRTAHVRAHRLGAAVAVIL